MTTQRQDATEAELRRRIAANPDDLEARHVFADVVEEAGFVHRAAMTRAQTAARSIARDDPGWLAAHADIRDSSRAAAVGDFSVGRGLPEVVPRYMLVDRWLVRSAVFAEHGARCLREHPIESVHVIGSMPAVPDGVRRLRVAQIERIEGALPASLESIDLFGPTDDSIGALAASESQLRSLAISRPIDEPLARAIARSSHPLERLEVSPTSTAAAAAIAERPLEALALCERSPSYLLPPLPPTIERLHLRARHLSRRPVREVFDRGLEPTDLLFEGDLIDARVLGELFEAISLDRLERLALKGSGIRDDVIALLCAHPVIEQLTELDISHNHLDRGLEILARSGARSLRALDISGPTCQSRGLRELLESGVSDSLAYLGVYGVADPEALALLLEPGVTPNLRWYAGEPRLYADAGEVPPIKIFASLDERYCKAYPRHGTPPLWAV